MCNRSCTEFGKAVLKPEDVDGKVILEVGSYDVNGSLRPVAEAFRPTSYTGVDLISGPGVDEVCDITDLVRYFGVGVFDVVIATEVLEHVKWWRKGVTNLKHVLKPGGIIIVTVPTRRCGYHGTPEDHWRFEYSDLKAIFSDFEIEEMWMSPEGEGVFLKARRPKKLIEFDTSNYKLYSIMKKRRTLVSRGIEVGIFRAGIFLKSLRAKIFNRQPVHYGKSYISSIKSKKELL